jgi:hypothetical protein
MKHLMIATVASLALISAAAAQTSTTTTTTGGATVTTGGAATTGTVVIQPEVRTRVREYVTTNRGAAVAAPSGFTVRRGVALPQTVELQSFPSTVGVTQYRYVVIGGQTVLVDPSSREIVEVIE